MPSVKSYQNRKKEVSILQARVRVLESQLNREKLVSGQNLEAANQNHNVELKELQNKVFTLESTKRILTVAIQIQAPLVDALSKANRELECKIRIYREYVLRVYGGEPGFYPEPAITEKPIDLGCALPPVGWICTRMPGHEGPCAAVQTVEVPSCLKPLDALQYIGKKIKNGPDNLSQ